MMDCGLEVQAKQTSPPHIAFWWSASSERQKGHENRNGFQAWNVAAMDHAVSLKDGGSVRNSGKTLNVQSSMSFCHEGLKARTVENASNRSLACVVS